MFLNGKQASITRRSTILVHCLLALGPLGAVTCYSSDGHVAVEPVLHGCCSIAGSEHRAGSPTDTPPYSGSDSHEHCQDIPFSALIKTTSRASMLCEDLVGPEEIPHIDLAHRIAQSLLPALAAEVPANTPHVYTPLATIVLRL